MVSEGDTCTRCEQGVLVVDDLEGFLLCPSCGYVADDTQLTDTTHAGGTATGAVIAENDDGSGAAAFLASGMGWRGGGGSSKSRGERVAIDLLEGAASTLQFPAAVTKDASDTLREVRSGRLVHIGGYCNTAAAQVAGVLYLAARRASMPLLLADVAAALNVTMPGARNQYLALISALNLHLPPPSSCMRAMVLRQSSQLLEQHPELASACPLGLGNAPKPAQGGMRGRYNIPQALSSDRGVTTSPRQGTTGQAGVVGTQAAGEGMGYDDVRQVPVVKSGMALAELVAKLGIGEGRPPRALAGAVLLLVLGPEVRSSTATIGPAELISEVAGIAHTNKAALSDCKKMIEAGLLQVAALLPMGSAISSDNLPAYLPLLSSLVHTLVAMKRSTEQAAGTQAAAPQPGLPSAAATGQQGAGSTRQPEPDQPSLQTAGLHGTQTGGATDGTSLAGSKRVHGTDNAAGRGGSAAKRGRLRGVT